VGDCVCRVTDQESKEDLVLSRHGLLQATPFFWRRISPVGTFLGESSDSGLTTAWLTSLVEVASFKLLFGTKVAA